MGVYRAGVRVTRALTPASSSSSSDDDVEVLHKSKVRKILAKSGSFQHMSTGASNVYQVENVSCRLFDDVFELSSLGDVLSLQSWNKCLSEEERQQLCAHLPEMDHETFQETLRDLLSGNNMFFGSPLEHLWQQLKDGLCDPHVSVARKSLISLQRREYYHDLRHYHNGMVSSLMEMRELWMSDPSANLEEKLSIWKAQKSSEGLKAVSDSQGKGKLKRISLPTRCAKDGATKHEDSDGQHESMNAHEELPSCLGLDLNQDFYYTYSEEAMHIPARAGDTDQLKNSSIFGRDLSSSGAALQDGLKPNQMPTSLEGSACRSDQSKCMTSKEFRALEYVDDTVPIAQNGRYKAINDDDLEAVMRGSSRTADGKVHKSDKQLPSGFQKNWPKGHTIKRRKRMQSAFVPPLTPGFAFSTLNFLSAVRAALVGESTPNKGKRLPFREIVAKVEAYPGDVRVLEVQMPLDCMVRGALKSLSSSSEVLAMDGFEPLVSYNKVTGHWSWVGHLSGRVCTFKEIDLHAVSKVWSLSALILSELLDIFEKWLKNKETTLRQIWQLSQIPLPVLPVFPSETERFGDLRAQKSSGTIPHSSYEMRALFQKEELVRYSTIEIAFRYTTADGRKSAVAPLKKLGGKSKAKARDHFMLRLNRPSHITVLCLVRDAAARLPQGIGTRGDVCTLLRDSQFIENVPEVQLNHVVSGALDRLHHERDPCVVYNQDRRIWLYLHGDREEEDFEEGGTVSTRISRRKAGAGGLLTVSPAQGNSFTDMSEAEADSDLYIDHNGSLSKPASPSFLHADYEKAPARLLQGPTGGHPLGDTLLSFIDVKPSVQPLCGKTHPSWEVYKGGKELSIAH